MKAITPLVAILFLLSCGNNNFADDILKMQSRPIDLISCEEAICLNGGKSIDFDGIDSINRLIIYIDSTSCSQCFITHMSDYMKTVEEFNSAGVGTIFVFEPKHEHEKALISFLMRLAYPVQTIVVPNGNFSSANPHLPLSSVLHVFLLNRNNEVVVVGNPAKNEKVKELMLNSIKQ